MRVLLAFALFLLPLPALAGGIAFDLPRLTWPEPEKPVAAPSCQTASKPLRCVLPE